MVKKNMSVSVTADLLDWFSKHCDDNCINKSGLVEKFIMKYKGENEKK